MDLDPLLNAWRVHMYRIGLVNIISKKYCWSVANSEQTTRLLYHVSYIYSNIVTVQMVFD